MSYEQSKGDHFAMLHKQLEIGEPAQQGNGGYMNCTACGQPSDFVIEANGDVACSDCGHVKGNVYNSRPPRQLIESYISKAEIHTLETFNASKLEDLTVLNFEAQEDALISHCNTLTHDGQLQAAINLLRANGIEDIARQLEVIAYNSEVYRVCQEHC